MPIIRKLPFRFYNHAMNRAQSTAKGAPAAIRKNSTAIILHAAIPKVAALSFTAAH
jgi:hypothetical protein